MARTSAETCSGAFRKTWRRAALGAALTPVLLSTAAAQRLSDRSLGATNGLLGDLIWWAVTAGTALAALIAFGLYLRNRRDEQVLAAGRKVAALNAALDRTRALLDADDQRTVVWDTAVTDPQVFGGLPERTGAPAERNAFLSFRAWLSPESAVMLEEATDKLRRTGEGFQIALRTAGGTLVEATGRTSGRRAILRLRELSGERKSFAELKEQAIFVIGELSALRALADMLPIPLWRRNRIGKLTWVNAAYVRAVDAASQESVLTAGIELLPSRSRDAIRAAHIAGRAFNEGVAAIVAGGRRQFEIMDAPIEDGAVGAAIDMTELTSVREELRAPDAKRTRARSISWRPGWQCSAGTAASTSTTRRSARSLACPGSGSSAAPEESAILDQLRADRKLPEQSNYRDWRARHLAAYQASEPREELWHLPDGRTLRVVALPNSDGGMIYIYENVTQEIMLESRLTALSQLQGATLDHLSEAVAVFGTDGRLRLFNPVFAEIWRLSPMSLRAEPHISEIIANCQVIHDDKAAWDEIRAAVTDLDRDEQTSGRMERPDGSVIDYATVALTEGMTMLTFVDVTDSARIERVLKERNEALEAADRLKSDFIQHVSYELRSPLQTIIGFSELLFDQPGKLRKQQREYMGHINSSSRALLALINDILDLATVDAGIMMLDIAETDIAAVVASSVEGLRDRLEEQKITLEIVVPDDIGIFHVDAQRVRQILFNLVSNAIRFSNAGGHIRVAAAREGNHVTFTVEDDGVGIPKEAMAGIFEPFETYAVQGRRGGAGLGLSIVKSLVKLHGGSVDIRSEEGKGTTAIVRLPVVPAAIAVAAE